MATRKELSQTEKYIARWQASNSGRRREIWPAKLKESEPEGTFDVDVHLREAFEAEILVANEFNLVALRTSLNEIVMDAEGEAAAFHLLKASKDLGRARRKQARALIDALQPFIADMLVVAARMEQVGAKWPELADMPDLGGASDLASLHYHGLRVIELLEPIATEEAIDPARAYKGREPDHSVDRYFRGLQGWWQRHANEPSSRRSIIFRNRIASSLWCDLGYPVPESYPSREAWAGMNFRNLQQEMP